MPISTEQLHHAVKYLVKRCQYKTVQSGTTKLTHTHEKYLENFLYGLLYSLRRLSCIEVGIHKKSMKTLRQFTGENNILFPKGITLINGNGKTTRKGRVIYDYELVKTKANRNANADSILCDSSSSIGRPDSSDVSDTVLSNEDKTLTYQFSQLSIRRTPSQESGISRPGSGLTL